MGRLSMSKSFNYIKEVIETSTWNFLCIISAIPMHTCAIIKSLSKVVLFPQAVEDINLHDNRNWGTKCRKVPLYEGHNASQIHDEMKAVYGDKNPSYDTVLGVEEELLKWSHIPDRQVTSRWALNRMIFPWCRKWRPLSSATDDRLWRVMAETGLGYGSAWRINHVDPWIRCLHAGYLACWHLFKTELATTFSSII